MFALHPTVPAGLCVALFKGSRPGLPGVYNALGRLLDHGPYAHMEVVTAQRVSLSSSFMDHGVRGKLIGYSSVGNWDFLPIPDPTGEVQAGVWRYFAARQGWAYDVWGNVRFAIGFASESPDKEFCSEFCMGALGFGEAWRYGPSGAATALQHFYKTKIIEVN